MPERFEIYIVYKMRYINMLPFLSFFTYDVQISDVCTRGTCAKAHQWKTVASTN